VHIQQDWVEHVTETVVLAEETLNLLLVATGGPLNEVWWDLTDRLEGGSEAYTVIEARFDVMGRVATEEDFEELLTPSVLHAGGLSSPRDLSETLSTPTESLMAAARRPVALAAAESVTGTDNYVDGITHVSTNAWSDPMTEIILWAEAQATTKAVTEEKLEYLPLESFPDGRLTERVRPRDQVEGSKS
jgi:hypothetical protein